MKTIILSLSLVSSLASANIGGGGFGYQNAYALRGNYECGPSSDGVVVTIDMENKSGEIKGKKTTSLSFAGGGPRNGNAYYKFNGSIDGKSFVVNFQSEMGAKSARFQHPGTGKQYSLNCMSVQSNQGGF